MGAVTYRVGWLLRRHWKATVAFALVAGLVGGVAMAAWAASRRNRAAYVRFVDHVAEPQYGAFFCDPAVPTQSTDSFNLGCTTPYEPTAEIAFLRSLPGVESVAETNFIPVQLQVAGQTFQGAISNTRGSDIVTAAGDPVFVYGRAPSAANDLAVNESAVFGLPLGTPVVVRPLDPNTGSPLDLPAQTMHLTGITRFPLDLAVAESKIEQVDGTAFTSAAWWQEWGDRVQTAGTGVLARLAPGTAVADIRAAVAAHWPGRYVADIPENASKVGTVSDAIGYEANALLALAVTTLLAGLVFVGQALTRQSRREQGDLLTLQALGFRRRQAIASAALRGLPVGIVATIVAITVAWLSSWWTPIGLAAKAETTPGLLADPLVYAIGGVSTMVFVALAMTLPTLRRPTRITSAATYGTRLAGAAWLRPPGVAGVGMASSRRAGSVRLGAALTSLTIAAAVIVASATIVASLDRTVAMPARYGARWNAIVGIDVNSSSLFQVLPQAHDVSEAGGMYESAGLVDGKPYPVIAMTGLKRTSASAWSTIVGGRGPERDTEVALGAATMRDLNVHLGSKVGVQVSDGTGTVPLTVVGQAVFNDSSTLEAGSGALITESLDQAQRNVSEPDRAVLRFRPGTDPNEALAPLASSGASWFAPTPPAAIRNLRRVSWLPWALALLVALLGAGALAHALVTSVRAHRRELAVLRTLGFTPRQAGWAVLWEALALVAIAVVIGVPLGIALGRWGWNLLADQIGIPAAPAIPMGVAPAVVGVMAALALVVAAWPSRRASRVAPALALRTE